MNGFRGELNFCSNFFPVSITGKDGRVWPTAEHYFQALKTDVVEEQEAIRNNCSAAVAKHLGRRVTIRKDWLAKRVAIMTYVVRAKFAQHPELAKKLIATKGDLIEWNDWGDTFWGKSRGTKRGENHLGKILMALRAELSQSKQGQLPLL